MDHESKSARPAGPEIIADDRIEIVTLDEYGWKVGLVDGIKVGRSYSEGVLREYCKNWPARKAKLDEFREQLREEAKLRAMTPKERQAYIDAKNARPLKAAAQASGEDGEA